MTLATVMALTLGSVGVMPSLSRAAEFRARVTDAGDFDERMAQAEQARSQGEHPTAARAYAKAYEALPEEERAGPMGELVLDNALAEYEQARAADSEDERLLEEPVALLESWMSVRQAAHEAGQTEAVPPRLEEALAMLKTELSALRVVAQPPEPEPEVEPVPPSEVEPLSSESAERVSDPPPEKRIANIAIVASGVASLIGGVSLIGGGTWNFRRIEQQREERFGRLNEEMRSQSEQEAYALSFSDWEQRWRGIGTGMVVAGSVLAAAGVGLTAWGVLRMRRAGTGTKRRASLGVPMVSRRQLGVAVVVGF